MDNSDIVDIIFLVKSFNLAQKSLTFSLNSNVDYLPSTAYFLNFSDKLVISSNINSFSNNSIIYYYYILFYNLVSLLIPIFLILELLILDPHLLIHANAYHFLDFLILQRIFFLLLSQSLIHFLMILFLIYLIFV